MNFEKLAIGDFFVLSGIGDDHLGLLKKIGKDKTRSMRNRSEVTISLTSPVLRVLLTKNIIAHS